MIRELKIRTHGEGLHEFTAELVQLISSSGIDTGLCILLIQHTSASLIVQENADPSAKRDLELWLRRLVPERDPLYTHTAEGPDDMPAHIRAALTQTCLTLPFKDGELLLGTWQGVYLWEHRHSCHDRRVVVQLLADTTEN